MDQGRMIRIKISVHQKSKLVEAGSSHHTILELNDHEKQVFGNVMREAKGQSPSAVLRDCMVEGIKARCEMQHRKELLHG